MKTYEEFLFGRKSPKSHYQILRELDFDNISEEKPLDDSKFEKNLDTIEWYVKDIGYPEYVEILKDGSVIFTVEYQPYNPTNVTDMSEEEIEDVHKNQMSKNELVIKKLDSFENFIKFYKTERQNWGV